MTSDAQVDPAAPSGYRILFELGRGGMGAAFLARAEGVGGFERLVVIKRIRPERVDSHSVARFLREARIAAAIHHANVVSAQNVGQDAEGPFIVLDYVDGSSLEELVDRTALGQRAMPVEIALRIAVDTLAGLEAVHQAHDAHGRRLNVLHRDVSLQNILVGVDGVARLLDFGIARSDIGGITTDQHYLVGKLAYLPPEYLRREQLTPSADVYALGVTLWLALTGAEPWPEASEAQVLRHILEDGVPSLSLELQVAPEIVELVARACAKEREHRFQTAREMAAQIEFLGRERGWLATHHEVGQWLNELSGADLARRRARIAALADEPAAPRLRDQSASGRERPAVDATPARRRRRFAVVVAVLTVAAGVLAAGGLLLRRSSERAPLPPLDPIPAPASATASVPVLAVEPAAPSVWAGSSAGPSASVSAIRPSPTHVSRGAAQKPGAPGTAVAPSARPPDQISKHNPYRE